MSEIEEVAVYACTGCGTEAIGAVPEVLLGFQIDSCYRPGLCPECNQKCTMKLESRVDRVVVGHEVADLEAVDERSGVAIVSDGREAREVPMDEVTPA